MIYVDSPVFKKSAGGRKSYAHMVADSIEEVREFAERIGVKKHFWHSQEALSHFDITSDQQTLALAAGAKLVTSRELVSLARIMNGETT
jgi:hypothetical protein